MKEPAALPCAVLFAFLTIAPAIAGAQGPGWMPMHGVAIEADASGWSRGGMTTTDFARGRIVSFGCHRAAGVLADTWEWGGSAWEPRDPARVPAARQDGILAWDSRRQKVVMFGGGVNSWTNETWEWDGATWTLRNLPVSPPARGNSAAAYDEARGRLVLFGGQAPGVYLGEMREPTLFFA